MRLTSFLTIFLLSFYCFSGNTATGSRNHLTRNFTETDSVLAFSFTLNTSARTSAGVFTKEGMLVRTLWSGVSYKAGTYKKTWDRKDDNGRSVADATYEVRVLTNNVIYSWDGTLGNSSSSATGSTKLRAFQGIHSMAITGNTIYYAVHYNEGWPAQYKVSTSNPQAKMVIQPDVGTGQATSFVATDGTNVYWAGGDSFNENATFVFATKVSDDTRLAFPSGSSIKMTYGTTYQSVINLVSGANAAITGLAVQKTGNYLFVARKNRNQIHVVHKTTGVVAQVIPMTSPAKLAIDANDNLWVMYGTASIGRFTVKKDGTLSSATLNLSGLVAPLDMAVSPDNSTIVVADGGASQQLKAYNTSAGQVSWTFGQEGGYSKDATVTNDKFYFSDNTGATETSNNPLKAFIAFAPDGSFWVGDAGNYRVQHYSLSRNFIERMMYLPHSYSVAADPNNPTRVFNEYLEFKVDYSLPLSANNGSWTLIKNWRAAVTPAFYGDNMQGIFRSTVTLSNGRTYALLQNLSNNKQHVVELPSTGVMRFTGVELAVHGHEMIAPDGSLRKWNNGGINKAGTWTSQPLTGFDGANNPVWGNPATLGSIAAIQATDPVDWGGSRPGQVTASGVIVSFDRDLPNGSHSSGYHLGGVKLSDNKWSWRTANITTTDYTGDFPENGDYDIGNGVKYAGSDVLVVDNNIFWNYHGEFWKQSQTNKWNHVYDNGLLVGQFGVVSSDFKNQEAFAMGAGNVLSMATVKTPDGSVYIYHNDESIHAGVHRWKVTGLNTIQVQTVPLSVQPAAAASGIGLMQGLPAKAVLKDNTSGWNRNPAAENYTDAYANWWSVKTNIKSYKTDSLDVYAKFRQSSGTYTVTRDLGKTSNLTSWQISGKLSWDGNQPNENNGQGGSYLEVLDDNGKVLTRLYTRMLYVDDKPNIYIHANDKIINSGQASSINIVTNKSQPLTIAANRSGITFSYANYNPVTTSIFDSEANWQTPKTLRLYFWTSSSGANYDRIIDIESMRFSSDAGTNTSRAATTPAPPTVVGDDAANTLTAAHALGNAEIVVSENNGPFAPYSGPIQVGNLARPAGYWQFKIKAATARNESELVKSPAFTVALASPAPSPAPSVAYNPNLIELAGQSNADGAVMTSFLPADLSKGPYPGCYIYTPATNAWQPIQPGANNQTKANTNKFGIELRLMKALQTHYGVNQYLIKAAYSGTALAQSAETDWSPASSQELYETYSQLHKTALATLSPADKRPPKAIVWIQGENDANAANAGAYEANLTTFIARKRADYGAQTAFVIVALSNSQTYLNATYRNQVRAAQAAVVQKVANCYLVSTDGLGMNGDGLHYDAAALNTIANKVYEVLIGMDTKTTSADEPGETMRARSLFDEEVAELSFAVYPNPVQSVLQIKHPVVAVSGSVEIYTEDGRIIGSWPLTAGSSELSINLRHLQSGVYLLRYSSGYSSMTSRFIKQ